MIMDSRWISFAKQKLIWQKKKTEQIFLLFLISQNFHFVSKKKKKLQISQDNNCKNHLQNYLVKHVFFITKSLYFLLQQCNRLFCQCNTFATLFKFDLFDLLILDHKNILLLTISIQRKARIFNSIIPVQFTLPV